MATPASALGPQADRDVYTVSRLNREARVAVESRLGVIWLVGELSNLARPASGHLYFSLKDEQASVRCAMFRMRSQLLGFELRNGLQLLVRGRVSLYEPRGDFQLVVDHMEPSGEGALRIAFELLKQRLAAEGLFDAARKRALPAMPRAIGVVSSPSGAAVRDIVSVLGRRCPFIPIVLYPVPVQGEAAAPALVAALALANLRAECDVLILARGGGSLEDLQAFNDERVARAIAASRIPTVSAIGHEIDFTIADFVADVRAATPSAGAELVGPDGAQLRQRTATQLRRLTLALRGVLAQQRERLRGLSRRLVHPGRRLQELMQRVDELTQRRERAVRVLLARAGARLATARARLRGQHPAARLLVLRERRRALSRRLELAMTATLRAQRERLALAGRGLHAVSPLATLERGYAILTQAGTGDIVRAVDGVTPGDALDARLAHGRLHCRVVAVHRDDAAGE